MKWNEFELNPKIHESICKCLMNEGVIRLSSKMVWYGRPNIKMSEEEGIKIFVGAISILLWRLVFYLQKGSQDYRTREFLPITSDLARKISGVQESVSKLIPILKHYMLIMMTSRTFLQRACWLGHNTHNRLFFKRHLNTK